MVCLLPAQQTDHVCERGRLRAAPVAAGALEAPRQAREREGYGPTKLAEPLVCGSRVADFGSCPCVYGDNLTIKHPLTGEPDAGDPPVRFGGRGSANTFSLPLSGNGPYLATKLRRRAFLRRSLRLGGSRNWARGAFKRGYLVRLRLMARGSRRPGRSGTKSAA